MLWTTRDFQGYFGWGNYFKQHFISDATSSVIIIILIFICPKRNIFKGESYEHLINWENLQGLFPWDLLLILGGSLIIAEGFQVFNLYLL